MAFPDPLKFIYLVILDTDDPERVTPFQGFSIGWRYVNWALSMLASLPADVLEPSLDLDAVIAQRMGNGRAQAWLPLSVATLESYHAQDFGPFLVCFTGDPKTAKRVARWAEAQTHPVLHVSSVDGIGQSHNSFSQEVLRTYCLKALEVGRENLTLELQSAADEGIPKWRQVEPKPSGLRRLGHNTLLPNHMSLDRAGRSFEEGGPFVGRSEAEYTAAIVESMQAVFRVRENVGARPSHAMMLPEPAIILAEPAFVRAAYQSADPREFKDRAALKVLRRLQTQKGLHSTTDKAAVDEMLASPSAMWITHERQSELSTFSLGLGLKAAQTCSAVMRLSPGVNHVHPKLSAYARHVRSARIESKLKAPRLFEAVQSGLRSAIGDERIAFIAKMGGPIKIIADAPIELVPIGNLPLSLRFDCSRINATPGNLMMSQIVAEHAITVTPRDIADVLVVSAFSPDDPLRLLLTKSIHALKHQWDGKVKVTFVSVRTTQEFADALNSFTGAILIFDGHGADNSTEPIGKIIIGDEAVDVWQLRGRARVPPIVVLSACDTHGMDASSHATVGNGFIALGAKTVLATLLPVDARASAMFVSRLIYRIADFIPLAISSFDRVLCWTEVISGMLRMQFASEHLDRLVGPPAAPDSPRGRLQYAANMDINSFVEAWYDNLLHRIAQHLGKPDDAIASQARGIVARSEAIRYVQLGNPESILIDDGSVRERVMNLYRVAATAD